MTDLVRTCELTYSEAVLHTAGISTHEMAFPDGDPPPERILERWLHLVESARASEKTIAVHCVAGLGRAPVLVAIALIELANFDVLDAVDYIRSQRKGAINRKQLQYLRAYRRRSKKRSGAESSCCQFM